MLSTLRVPKCTPRQKSSWAVDHAEELDRESCPIRKWVSEQGQRKEGKAVLKTSLVIPMWMTVREPYGCSSAACGFSAGVRS